MIPRAVSRQAWRRYLRRNGSSWAELESFPQLSPDKQREELGQRLLAQIRYFGSRADAFPEWREAARLNDPNELLRIWAELPVVTKNDLRNRFPAEEIGRRFKIEGKVNSSGGSTGEPVHFYHDMAMVKSLITANFFSALRMGWLPGMPTIIVWGSERDIKKRSTLRARVQGRLLNQLVVDSYTVTDETVERVCGLIQPGPVAIYGFTSMLEFVARRVLEMGKGIPPGKVKCAWNGGEMLYPSQSELFRQAFGVPILNRYGGREMAVMACQFNENGPLQIMRPWLFMEVLNERGRPAAADETGRLVWTSTICRGTPFIRYDVEDLGTYRACDVNESGVTAISSLQGRTAGLLELPGGRKISNNYWNHFFKEVPEVAQFQVILRKNGVLTIFLRGHGFSQDREASVRGLLGHFLGDLPVQLEWVERIPLTKEGKLVQVYREN